MARRPTSPPVPQAIPLDLTQPRTEVERRIAERITGGRELAARTIQSQEEEELFESDYRKWNDYNEQMLTVLFNTDVLKKEYRNVFSGGSLSMTPDFGMGHYGRPDVDKGKVTSRITKLESIQGRLELLPEPVVSSMPTTTASNPLDLTKVFVVHGHDEGAKHAVARFLEKIELAAIILQEQPDRGFTIIEKFETYANQVGFAVVLLTPDDIGGAALAEAQASRARQNVIFELGYFAGKLGRGRACLLRKGEVEIPSDLYGVIYTEMDAAEGWKLKLAKELKAAGLKFDGDKVF